MFSSNFTDLLQILEIDKNKFQHFGPPRFRINIPCKYGNQCKYGRYSCEYSHEAFCRFSKKGKKCLNSNCTYQHQLPVEYQLAQELLYLQMQISLESESLEARKSTSAYHFSTQTSQENGTSESHEFRFKVNDSSFKSTENNPNKNITTSSQPQNKAETRFTAFSPLFQHSISPRKSSTDHQNQLSCPKPTQAYSEMDKKSLSISQSIPPSAQPTIKTSEIPPKATHQIEDLPPRIFTSNQLPPR